jgi:hypothetical protein
MSPKYRGELLPIAVDVALYLSPFIGFAGVVGTAAALYGVHRDPPAPARLEIVIPPNEHRLSCVGEHLLRVSLPEGKYDFVPVADCLQDNVKLEP